LKGEAAVDGRVRAYAELLVDYCIKVQSGWQVLVRTTPLARPLLNEVISVIATRGAYPLVRLEDEATALTWAVEAPEALVGQMAPIERYVDDHMDGEIFIRAPENTRGESLLPPARRMLLRQAQHPVLVRRQSARVPWITCVYPTQAYAQDAGMALNEYEAFVFDACLIDWPAEGRRMRRIADRFDRADEVRITAGSTDLRMRLGDRRGRVGEGYGNMPGGEVFYSPIEDSATGTIVFDEYPAIWVGEEVEGIRLVFDRGRVVDASARRGEALLLRTLDTDHGSRVLGELGLGCNPRIQRYTRNILFDEKMAGTLHIAVGSGFPTIGGKNVSSIHWDMVKDLRRDSRIFCDGEVVQQNGQWVF
jgi:aminopeptidase